MIKSEVLYGENEDLTGEDLRQELWSGWDDQEEQMRLLRRDHAPGQHDYNDDYNQVNMIFNPRGVTGMENNTRMREQFVELEYWVEEVIGKPRTLNKGVMAYKGTAKKWQILDDDCFDREQIEKLQASVDAPMPEQLEEWAEGSVMKMQAPYNN